MIHFFEPSTHFVCKIEGLKLLLDEAVDQDNGRLKGSTIQAGFLEPV